MYSLANLTYSTGIYYINYEATNLLDSSGCGLFNLSELLYARHCECHKITKMTSVEMNGISTIPNRLEIVKLPFKIICGNSEESRKFMLLRITCIGSYS